MDANKVRQACNSLVESGDSITVAKVREKLVELYGYAGNNNTISPIVKLIKAELKKTAKSEDTDLVLSSAINDSLLQNVPGETKMYIDKFTSHLYQTIYDDVESSIISDRIEQLEKENEVLRERLSSFKELEIESNLLRGQLDTQSKDLIETNRLLDIQKVYQSGKLQTEIDHKNTLLQSLNIKIDSQDTFIEKLKNDNSVLSASIEQTFMESSNTALKAISEFISLYIADNNLKSEVTKGSTKLAKFINYLLKYLDDSTY